MFYSTSFYNPLFMCSVTNTNCIHCYFQIESHKLDFREKAEPRTDTGAAASQ